MMNDVSDDFVDVEDVMARITREQDAMLAADAGYSSDWVSGAGLDVEEV